MITFNGTQKEFFKAYPKEKRSLEETYKLINSAGEIEYKFVGSLGEKCFKKFVKNDNELKETENTKKLIDWILSEEGQELVKKVGYVPVM